MLTDSRKRTSFYNGSQGKAVGLAQGATVVFISLCTAAWRPCLKDHLPQQDELSPDWRISSSSSKRTDGLAFLSKANADKNRTGVRGEQKGRK